MGKIALQSGITTDGKGLVLIIMSEPTNDGDEVHVADMSPDDALRLALDLVGQSVKADYSAVLYKRLQGFLSDDVIKNVLDGIGDK